MQPHLTLGGPGTDSSWEALAANARAVWSGVDVVTRRRQPKHRPLTLSRCHDPPMLPVLAEAGGYKLIEPLLGLFVLAPGNRPAGLVDKLAGSAGTRSGAKDPEIRALEDEVRPELGEPVLVGAVHV